MRYYGRIKDAKCAYAPDCPIGGECQDEFASLGLFGFYDPVGEGCGHKEVPNALGIVK